MKYIIISATVLFSFLIFQVVETEAALADNEIKITENQIVPGPRFGEGWSEAQKQVWGVTEKFFQYWQAKNW